MKKLTFFLFIILSVNTYSQSPSNFTYQSVVRDGSGKLLSNKEISFRISVLKNSESGQVVFEEEHSVTTNINGLATLIVGKGSGNDDLGDIDWGDGSYFLKVEIDPEGGFNFIAEDTTQLLSVPYALYSSSSGSSLTITGQDYLSINNNELTVNKVDLTDDVVGILPIVNGGTGSSTVPMVGVITAADAASARNVLGLSTVASTGSYNDLTDKLTAGANIDITNGIISSTDTNTEYTAGTGISIDGNNAISSTITQYTDANAQAAFTAGANIDITNGIISSTDTNTEYTAGTGISIDGNNAISSTITQYTDANAQAAFTAGANIDITNGIISSTDTNTEYTAGTGISIDGNNAISSTITQYTDANAQAAFTAGANIDITNGIISSTDTNTEYTAGTGISIDGNNAISSTITQYTDANAQAAFTAGANIDITNGIISSTDTNTEYTAGTGISIDGNNAISTTITDTNTFRTVQADGTAIGDTEILNLVGGTNVTLTENAGEITITSTDNNTTYTAGTGLSLSTTTFNLNHLGFQDLSDPNSDRFIFWDDSESKIDWLSAASLFDIVGLSPDDDNFIVGNGTNFITESGATARSSLGLGTMATQDNTSVNIDGGNIDGSTISTSDITVGSGKTIDVSGGTLTLANNQISGDKVEGGTIASTTITSLTTNSITNSGKTIDNSGGISGVTTINATVGRVKINSGQSSINISNSYVDANSIIICTVAQNSDSTRYITQVVAGSGTFTIDLNGGAPGSGILINFLIIN